MAGVFPTGRDQGFLYLDACSALHAGPGRAREVQYTDESGTPVTAGHTRLRIQAGQPAAGSRGPAELSASVAITSSWFLKDLWRKSMPLSSHRLSKRMVELRGIVWEQTRLSMPPRRPPHPPGPNLVGTWRNGTCRHRRCLIKDSANYGTKIIPRNGSLFSQVVAGRDRTEGEVGLQVGTLWARDLKPGAAALEGMPPRRER